MDNLDLFAAAALAGMLASAPIVDRTSIDKEEWVRQAFNWAEAMKAEGKKRARGRENKRLQSFPAEQVI